MNNYRDRLHAASLFAGFEECRLAKDSVGMRRVLQQAGFTPLEVESILWAKGDLGPARVEPTQKDKIIGMIGHCIVSGVVLGASWIGAVSLSDYRSPADAYYKPFFYGFILGALLPLGRYLYREFKRHT
jgi:hypothetical protein